MRMDDFDAYMKQHAGPVLPNEAYDAKIRKTLHSLPEKNKPYLVRRTLAFAVQAAVIAVVILLVLPSGQAILSTPWLRAYSSEDGQQYIIEGNVLNTELVTEADADDENRIDTEDYADLIEGLGFDPCFPKELPGGWEADSYYAAWKTEGLSVGTDYIKTDEAEKWMRLSISPQYDPDAKEEQFREFADDGNGSMEEVGDILVYAEYDAEWDQSVLLWVMDNCLLEVQGSGSIENAKGYAALLTEAYRNLSDEERMLFFPTGERTGHPQELKTLDMQEVKRFVRGEFIVPESTPEGFELTNIWCARSDFSTHVNYDFRNVSDPACRVQIDVSHFKEIEGLATYYEQNGPGKYIRYRGKDIYVSYNIDWIVCIYLYDQNFYLVTGTIDWDEAKVFLDTLIDQQEDRK